jgi:hypothetical protein
VLFIGRLGDILDLNLTIYPDDELTIGSLSAICAMLCKFAQLVTHLLSKLVFITHITVIGSNSSKNGPLVDKSQMNFTCKLSNDKLQSTTWEALSAARFPSGSR